MNDVDDALIEMSASLASRPALDVGLGGLVDEATDEAARARLHLYSTAAPHITGGPALGHLRARRQRTAQRGAGGCRAAKSPKGPGIEDVKALRL